MKRDVFFTLNTLGTKRGGLVKAVIKRANTIVKAEPDRNLFLVTLGFQTRIDSVREEMIKLSLLDERIQVVNLINALARQRPSKDNTKKQVLKRLKRGVVVFEDASRVENDSYRIFENGVYTQYIRFDEQDRLVFIDYFSESRQRVRREEYFENGQRFQIINYSATTNKPVSRQFLHGNGICYLTLWHKLNSNDWSHLFFVDKKEQRQFNDPAEFFTFAFEKLLEKHPAVTIFSEFRDRLPNLPKLNLDAVVLNIKHQNAKKAAFGHSNHLVAPFDESATVSGVWNTMFKRINEWDAIITATNRQKEHLSNRFGHPSTFRALPHSIKSRFDLQDMSFDQFDKNRFVVISRIQIKKDVAESVRVMRHIVDHNPSAFMDFYGFGYNDQLEKDLHALIEELSLTKHIHFRGFVTDMRDAYEGAVATVFTSQSEGFGMAILESMSYGVPVISYNILYGPEEMIEHGVTGYLISHRETKKFADAAIELMENREKRIEMGKRAFQSIDRFSDEAFQKNWIAMLKELDGTKK